MLAVILCLVLGAAIGAWHGFWVAYVGIPAFIVTLASMLIFRGLTLVVLKGATVGGLPDGFEAMGNGFLPDVGPDTGLSNLTLVLAALLAVFLVALEFRKRASAIRYNFDVVPVGLFYAKLVAMVAVIMIFAYLLAQYRGVPIVGLILFVLIGVYGFITQRTVDRSPRLRHRRQRRRGHDVRCPHQAHRLPGDDQHGSARRPGRHGHRGPPDRGQPEGRHELRARRDRGGVHRRRGRHRRCRHGGRRDHRWLRDGCR